MADYSITEHIPVADHIYKYLVKICGSDTFVANRTSIIGNIILSSLGRSSDVNFRKSKFTKVFNIVINEHYYLKNGIHLSFKNAQVFNKMIDIQFREEMYRYLLISDINSTTDFYNGIKNYLKLFDITEDDIKLDTLYRDFKRKKENIVSKLTA